MFEKNFTFNYDTNQSQHLTLTAALSAAKGRTTITSCLTFSVKIIFSRPMDSLGESSQSAANFLGMSLGGEEDDEND